MTNPNASLGGVGDVEARLKAGQITATVACRVALRRGFLLIGTVEHKQVHSPRPSQTYYDLSLGAWVQLEDSNKRGDDILRASDAVGPAIMCAIFGDFNDPDERDRVGPKLTDQPRPRFGWTVDPRAEERLRLHARPEMLAAAREYGSSLTGNVDVVRFNPIYGSPGFSGDPGQVLSRRHAETIGTFAVTALDLPYDRIQPIDYRQYTVISSLGELQSDNTQQKE